jgi:hypothetical protein
MNWFERHLNWSLFLADFLLPVGINVTFLIIYLNILGRLFFMAGSSEELFIQNMFTSFMPVAIISIVAELLAFVVILVVTLWYLGKKGRSKGLVILLIGPWVFAFILAFFNTGRIGGILGGLGYLVGLIILLLLENRAIDDYGVDFLEEPVADHWRPDTGQPGATEDWRPPKELDYRPAKNVQDIAYGGVVKDVGDVDVPGGEVPAAFPLRIPEEIPAEASAETPPGAPEEIPAEISAEIPPEVPPEAPAEATVETLPGAPAETPSEAPVDIPPGAPAETPVEATVEATAEVPIVETPAEASAETPPEAPVETAAETRVEVTPEVPTEIPAEVPAEAKITEEAAGHEALAMPILLDDAGAVIKCFYHPDADAVNLCSRCRQYICSQCNYVTGTHPICRNCWDRRAEMPIAPAVPEAQKSPRLSKSEKREAEEEERLREFRQLYEQALPVISTVIKRDADGSPSPPLELVEGLKLRPMLEQVKKLSKPKEKGLQEARKEFEQLLLACIKVAETAEPFTLGEQAVPSEADLASLSIDIATANGLMQGLSQRLASLYQSPAD